LFTNIKRKFIVAAVGAFMLLLAFPVAVAAASLLNVDVDRTTVASGQNITFSIRTTTTANFVFAEVGASTVQATRGTADAAGQNWTLTVQPAATGTISVFANNTNNTNGAARVRIPVTVTGAAAPTVPASPAQPGQATGPLAIHSVTETPALGAGQVQLTVVVGLEANEVWVRFDQDRFRRGQEDTARRTANSRTFVINFQPASWTAQQVVVSANRQYVVAGANSQSYTLTLAAPFTRTATASIQQVNIPSRTVAPGTNVTFNIRTNPYVEYVWIVDVDGNRRNASRSGTVTATARNWTVSFNPIRTGAVRVYANTTDSATGAATRTETITVQSANASITSATASITGNQWANQWGSVTIDATTNYAVSRVWVDIDGRRIRLSQISGTGTGNRTWRVVVDNVSHHSQLTVHASVTDNYNTDTSRTVSVTGWNNWGWGQGSATVSPISGTAFQTNTFPANHHANQAVTFNITTNVSLTSLTISSGGWVAPIGTGGTQWTISLPWHQGHNNFTLTGIGVDGATHTANAWWH